MSEPRVQRTLVKSAPELWAEISDVSTLARHLGEFGDIRITRLENESTVVWEGDRACGTVQLEASGWGTKVTITAAAVEAPEPEPEPEPEPAAVAEAVEEPAAVEEPEAVEEPAAAAEPEAIEEPEAVVEPEAVEEPAPKRGFFARLFRRRAPAVPLAAPEPVAEPEPEPVAVVEPDPEPEPAAIIEPAPDPEPVAVAEPEPTAPALDDERVEAVLVGVLDDLGSAHHRPFSRG